MSFRSYRDPVVADVTARCDWRIADLVAGEKPTTLYLVVPPSDISRTKPRSCVSSSIGRPPADLRTYTRRTRHRLLLMLDEFPGAWPTRLLRERACFHGRLSDRCFSLLSPEPDRESLRSEQLDPRQLPRQGQLCDQRRAHRKASVDALAPRPRCAMQNYAGHRLAPWLGHSMISRSETAHHC